MLHKSVGGSRSRGARLGAWLALGIAAAWGCAGPPSDAPFEEVVRHNIRGTAYLGQQKWTEAEHEFVAALARRPGDPLLLNNLGVALLQSGRVDEAESRLGDALRSDSTYPYARYNLGLVCKNRGEFAEAATHFEAVRNSDADDVLTLYNLGLIYSQLDRNEEAETSLRAALEQDPNHVSSLYALGRLLLQRGDAEAGKSFIAESQRIRTRSGLDQTVGSQYGEQGPYAMGVDYPGDALAAPPPLDLAFEASGRDGPDGTTFDAWTLTRIGTDEVVDLVLVTEERVRSVRSREEWPIVGTSPGRLLALTAGVLDAAGGVDLVGLVTNAGGTLSPAVLRSNGDGSYAWVDVFTRDPSVPVPGGPTAADLIALDRDHDGDIDLFWCWTSPSAAGCSLATNDGSGSLTPAGSEEHGFRFDGVGAEWLTVTLTDFDNDRDVDLLVGETSGLHLFSNQRDDSYLAVGAGRGLDQIPSALAAMAVADLDKSGSMDLLVGGRDGLHLMANRRGTFAAAEMLGGWGEEVQALLVADADNDGFLDVVTSGADGRLSAQRNQGAGAWQATGQWVADRVGRPLAALDADGDGDHDLAVRTASGQVELLINRGGEAHGSIAIDPRGVGDNRLGIGAKIEVLSGALRQRFEVSDPAPLLVGLGERPSVESARFLWPSGVMQDEVDLAAGDALRITQLDRKGTSCPLLYTWRGGRWWFVTDFLGGCALGYQIAPGVYGTPDTDEYVKIEAGIEAGPDGLLRLRVNNQLEEVIWFDQTELIVVDHPAGTEVFPDERLMPGPPWPEFRLFASSDIRPLRSALSVETSTDVTALLTRRDRRYVDDFELLPFKGYAELHTLELDLGAFPADEPIVLLLDGWIDYADSSANLAAHQAGIPLVTPRLTVADGRGGWVETGHRMGFPAGLPKTMTVELTGLFPTDDHRLRIATGMRIYWDRIRLLVGGRDAPMRIQRMAPLRADLRYGGFPREVNPDGRPPSAYDPRQVSARSSWKAHVGSYTSFGDVADLVTAVDDRLVATKAGDEMELVFPAPRPVSAGWTRSYLLYADGFGKDMDPNSAASSEVGPVPFHGMPGYPYPPELVPPVTADSRNGRRVLPSAEGWPGAVPLALADAARE